MTSASDVATTAPTAGADRHRLTRRLWREPALLLSFAYFSTSAIGLWASYWYYQPFGINILQFMEVTDFLAAGLRDPAYLAVVAGAVAIHWFVNWPDRWRERNPERAQELFRRWWMRWIVAPHWHFAWLRRFSDNKSMFWTAFGIGWLTLWLLVPYERNLAQHILAGDGRAVTFVAEADVRAGLCPEPRFIGTNSLYVFLYCPDRRRLEVVPIESVGRLSFAIDDAAEPLKPETIKPEPARP